MPFTSQLIFPQSHSIMSYNIRYDNEWDKVNSWEIRKDEVIKLIYEYDPGIIGIQEGLLNQVQYVLTVFFLTRKKDKIFGFLIHILTTLVQ